VVRILGAVVQPRLLTVQQLRTLPSVTQTILTECAGNGRASLEPPVSGEQWTSRAVSTAQWTGVSLRSVLELRETAVEVVFTGADGGRYQRSLPRDVATDAGTMLAYEMNGSPILGQFGGPVRLVVPDWYGMASVKWLARIEAVEKPFRGEFQARRYVYAEGVPVTRIRIKSMFTDVPDLVPVGVPVRVMGLAWGGEGVRGSRWRSTASGTRRGWSVPSCPTHGAASNSIGSRLPAAATSSPAGPPTWRGRSQPDEPEWNVLGYGNNAVQRVELLAT